MGTDRKLRRARPTKTKQSVKIKIENKFYAKNNVMVFPCNIWPSEAYSVRILQGIDRWAKEVQTEWEFRGIYCEQNSTFYSGMRVVEK